MLANVIPDDIKKMKEFLTSIGLCPRFIKECEMAKVYHARDVSFSFALHELRRAEVGWKKFYVYLRKSKTIPDKKL